MREHERQGAVGDLLGVAVAPQGHPTAGVLLLGFSGIASVMPVRIGPGQTQLTVTPVRPSSTANDFVSPITPAFVAA